MTKEELCRLEQSELVKLIDEGRLVYMPCKVGDTVYIVRQSSCEDTDGFYAECKWYGFGADDRICCIPKGTQCPYIYRVDKLHITVADLMWVTRAVGKTVFLTAEEAEQALKESEVKTQ